MLSGSLSKHIHSRQLFKSFRRHATWSLGSKRACHLPYPISTPSGYRKSSPQKTHSLGTEDRMPLSVNSRASPCFTTLCHLLGLQCQNMPKKKKKIGIKNKINKKRDLKPHADNGMSPINCHYLRALYLFFFGTAFVSRQQNMLLIELNSTLGFQFDTFYTEIFYLSS